MSTEGVKQFRTRIGRRGGRLKRREEASAQVISGGRIRLREYEMHRGKT